MSQLGNNQPFYIVEKERGAECPAIPTWANHTTNPAGIEESAEKGGQYQTVEGVPGAFQLLNVLNEQECAKLIELSESIGFLEDAAVSLPRSVRHNDSVTWVVDKSTNKLIWNRCAALVNQYASENHSTQALGLNSRFRFYRYQQADYFAPHTDGSWPGSEVINQKLITNAYDDRWSELTFLLFLSDNYEGGRTQFFVNSQTGLPAKHGEEAQTISVRTPLGGVLCFAHGVHPLDCLHSSEAIESGAKYIIRTDVLFSLS